MQTLPTTIPYNVLRAAIIAVKDNLASSDTPWWATPKCGRSRLICLTCNNLQKPVPKFLFWQRKRTEQWNAALLFIRAQTEMHIYPAMTFEGWIEDANRGRGMTTQEYAKAAALARQQWLSLILKCVDEELAATKDSTDTKDSTHAAQLP